VEGVGKFRLSLGIGLRFLTQSLVLVHYPLYVHLKPFEAHVKQLLAYLSLFFKFITI
jgi:hypothetical protein